MNQAAQQYDIRSDGLHQGLINLAAQKYDPRSNRPHQSENSQNYHNIRVNCPKVNSGESNHHNHCRKSSIDSNDTDDGYDMLTGANLTPQMVPEFLTGRPMQSRTNIPHQDTCDDDLLDVTLPAQQVPIHTNTMEGHPHNLQ